jgi:AsmA protein
MPSPVMRRVILGASALLLVVAVVLAAIPYVAATQLVRDRIAFELSMWSGYKVTLGSAPQIDIWPMLKADLANVTFTEWQGNPQPVIHADRIEAGLSPLAALRGDVVFNDVKLTRPTLHVWREARWCRSRRLPTSRCCWPPAPARRSL